MEESESSNERIVSEIFLNGKDLNNPLLVSYIKKGMDHFLINYNERVWDPLFIKYKKRGWELIEGKEEKKQGRKNQKSIQKCL